MTEVKKMSGNIKIRNGMVFTEDGLRQCDVCIKAGKISFLGAGEDEGEYTEIDATGQYVLPGFIDPHVHLNDPGLTNSEDFYTGTCAAAAGGITTVLEHPLTFPLPDNLKAFNEKKSIGERKSIINFGLFGACSENNENEMEKMIANGAIAFKTFLTYSPEIPRLNDGQIIDRMKFLSDKDIVLAIHCENNDIVEYYTKKLQEEGRIEIRATVEGDDIRISISDNGIGMKPETAEAILNPEKENTSSTGNGIGLRNIDERIKLSYGSKYGLSIWSEPDEGTVVTILIPHLPPIEPVVVKS